MQFPISTDMIRQGTVLLQQQQTQYFQCVSHMPQQNKDSAICYTHAV